MPAAAKPGTVAEPLNLNTYVCLKDIMLSKDLGYLDNCGYEELSAKSLENLKTLQGLISHIESSGV